MCEKQTMYYAEQERECMPCTVEKRNAYTNTKIMDLKEYMYEHKAGAGYEKGEQEIKRMYATSK